ncbi:MAG: hypothetical protein EAZ47_07755 [Bacteroidetes bacterium]|nr:MAG: hypothetical protein EAY72_11510 [Bacteroidota bacterium]TAF93000.1 MAG: hypothetical protein EAZ47_07755 [Bacteroidota bacterium]
MLKKTMSLLLIVACLGCESTPEVSADDTSINVLDNPARPAGTYADVSENPLIDRYPKVPGPPSDILSKGAIGAKVFDELKLKYTQHLVALRDSVEKSGAHFVLLLLSPAVHTQTQGAESIGMNFIAATAQQNNIDVIDARVATKSHTPLEITQYPKDGHWSKKGASLVADYLVAPIQQLAQYKNPTTYKERPSTFNDLEPNLDEVLDGNKNLPYHLVTNSKGMRMSSEPVFPKTKQRFVFIGDSNLYCPFLENNEMITSLLQTKLPQVDVYNCTQIGYTVNDYISLYTEKAKYLEPDVVVVSTSASSVADFFFTHRNRFARIHQQFAPSENEKQLYKALFGNL